MQPGAIPVIAPGQVAPAPGTSGWLPAGQHVGDAESARAQLDASYRQLNASYIASQGPAWQSYLALPPEVSMPNQTPNPQSIQTALQKYESISHDPQYSALSSRPDFQQTLASLRRMSDIRTASNPSSQLPPPPGKHGCLTDLTPFFCLTRVAQPGIINVTCGYHPARHCRLCRRDDARPHDAARRDALVADVQRQLDARRGKKRPSRNERNATPPSQRQGEGRHGDTERKLTSISLSPPLLVSSVSRTLSFQK